MTGNIWSILSRHRFRRWQKFVEKGNKIYSGYSRWISGVRFASTPRVRITITSNSGISNNTAVIPEGISLLKAIHVHTSEKACREYDSIPPRSIPQGDNGQIAIPTERLHLPGNAHQVIESTGNLIKGHYRPCGFESPLGNPKNGNFKAQFPSHYRGGGIRSLCIRLRQNAKSRCFGIPHDRGKRPITGRFLYANRMQRSLQMFRKKSKFTACEMREQQLCPELPACIRTCVNI